MARFAVPAAPALVLGLLAAGCGGPVRADDGPRPSTVVVGTSMLRAAVEAVPFLDGKVHVEVLVPPGSCPGHFDLRLEQLACLRRADAILYPDYQSGLGDKLAATRRFHGRLLCIGSPTSPLQPSAFEDLVEEVAARLETVNPAWEGRLLPSLGPTRRRLRALALELQSRAAFLADRAVIASSHQASFCRWLGLRVVAELPRNGDTAPARLTAAFDRSARLVVADLQEGTGAAEAVGERMGIPVVVLSAFPGAPGYGSTYEELLQHNLEHLMAPWRRSASPSKG